MKFFLARFKLFIFIASVVVAAPLLAIAANEINTINAGYNVRSGSLSTVLNSSGAYDIISYVSIPAFHRLNDNVSDNINIAGTCFLNRTKDKNFFVPTRTVTEWNKFYNNLPKFSADDHDKKAATNEITTVGCIGDGYCDTSFENCDNSPGDCCGIYTYSKVVYQKQTTGGTNPPCFSPYSNFKASSTNLSTVKVCVSLVKAQNLKSGDNCITGIDQELSNTSPPRYCIGHYNSTWNRCVYYETVSPSSYSNGPISTITVGASPVSTAYSYNSFSLPDVDSLTTNASFGFCDACYADGSCCNYDGICNQPDDNGCPDCQQQGGCSYQTISHGYIDTDCGIYCDSGYTSNNSGCVSVGGGSGGVGYTEDPTYWPPNCGWGGYASCDDPGLWKSY